MCQEPWSTELLSRWLHSIKTKVCLPIVWVGLTELGLFSWGRLSEFRVARGLAIGAVDLSFVSPVQRRVNWSVGPWENVSNGGNLWWAKRQNPTRISVLPCTKFIRENSQNGDKCHFESNFLCSQHKHIHLDTLKNLKEMAHPTLKMKFFNLIRAFCYVQAFFTERPLQLLTSACVMIQCSQSFPKQKDLNLICFHPSRSTIVCLT